MVALWLCRSICSLHVELVARSQMQLLDLRARLDAATVRLALSRLAMYLVDVDVIVVNWLYRLPSLPHGGNPTAARVYDGGVWL
jgi:hypothetical protein